MVSRNDETEGFLSFLGSEAGNPMAVRCLGVWPPLPLMAGKKKN